MNRENYFLTIIVYSFPPGDCADFGPDQSTKPFSLLSCSCVGEWFDRLPDPFRLRAPLTGHQLSLELHSNLLCRLAQQVPVHMTVGAVKVVDLSGG